MTDYSSWTAPVEKVRYNVYLGAWTNWQRGRVLGATLTLEPRYGLLLLSFTATFVGFVASRFWRIITLMLHRIYSTPEPRDALHHQRQVVLRNALSAASTLWTSLQLAWSWRSSESAFLARTLPTIISAALALGVFTVAGGFTSSISSGIGDEVLIDGAQCGVLTTNIVMSDALSVLYPYLYQSMNNAANYAQQCYSFNATGTLDCTTFVKSRLQFSSDLKASCPFNDSICRSNNSNLLLDSGLISSNDLGQNMPSGQPMFYRTVLHCAPLSTDEFVSNANTEYNNYTRYWYGDSRRHNWTYEAENLDAKYRRQTDNPAWMNTKGFSLMPLESRFMYGTVWTNTSDFVPIPQLFVSDADLLVAFLSPEGIFFTNRTDDPWYRAIVPSRKIGLDGYDSQSYVPDEAASPLGCAQRYQFCNANKKCGSLSSWLDAVDSAAALFHLSLDDSSDSGPDVKLEAMASRFAMFALMVTSSSGLYALLITLGSSSLLSSQHLGQGLMGPLPSNQWQLDVSYWFAMYLASLQAAFVNSARGPTDEALVPYTYSIYDEYQREMCNNQKILSTDYTSLSLFGLYFTYATGIIIILASYVAEPLLALFYSRRKYEEYKYLEWAANSTLQLQRLAYQGLGSAKWSNYTDDIPKTRPGYFLADLARAYPPGDDDKQVQGMKPTVHAISTTTPSVSGTSANLRVSEQSRGAPSRPVSAVSESAPQAVSPQAVSPISQHPQG